MSDKGKLREIEGRKTSDLRSHLYDGRVAEDNNNKEYNIEPNKQENMLVRLYIYHINYSSFKDYCIC